MTKAVKDSFLDLEKHRQLLEENIEKLRKLLLHWQIWEAEYEALKEEIISVGPEPSHDQLIAICKGFDATLITQAEAEDILGIKVCRNSEQITNILSRRIDYVSQNVKTLNKQLDTAENKLMAATVISNPDVRNEEGLPMTDIIEELDEDGNVLSGRTETQKSAKGQLQEVLEKAGIRELPKTKQEPNSETPLLKYNNHAGNTENEVVLESVASDTSNKSVHFQDGKVRGQEIHKSQTEQRTEALVDAIKQNNAPIEGPPIIPANESLEDSAMRKEMLQYGMSEVGVVVAELDLEDGNDLIEDDYNESDVSSTEDEEDKFGRSTKKVVDEEMRRRMIELEEKLGLRMMENVGQNPILQAVGDIGSRTTNTMGAGEESDILGHKKSVRFAEKLNISQSPPAKASPEIKAKAPMKSPIRDIIERSPHTEESEQAPSDTKKISRFMSGRAVEHSLRDPDEPSHSQTNAIPARPVSTPLVDTIIEREIPLSAPPEPDEFDQKLLHQEVVNEYHRIRNRMIQKQGGFMKDHDLEKKGIIPLTEEEGGPRKISRFKSARLAKG